MTADRKTTAQPAGPDQDRRNAAGEVFRLELPAGRSATAPQFRDLADIRSDRLRRLHEEWLALRDGDRLPRRDQLQIDRLGYVLPNLNLVDVQRDPLDFRCRVHSVKGSDYVGANLTGRSVRDYPDPTYAAFVWAVFEAAMRSREAKLVSERLIVTGSRIFRWEGVVMPLEAADGEVDKLLVAFELFDHVEPR